MKHLAFTYWLQAQPTAVKSQAVTIGSVSLSEKIDLLEGNVESLLKNDQSINEEIKAVKSNVNSVKFGLANQIQQINVCNILYGPYSISSTDFVTIKYISRKILMVHLLMQVPATSIFNKEVDQMEVIL